MSSNYQQVAIDTVSAHAQRIRQAAALPALIEALQKISDIAKSHPYAGVTCGEIAREALAKAGVRT